MAQFKMYYLDKYSKLRSVFGSVWLTVDIEFIRIYWNLSYIINKKKEEY